jgi:AcrR family transcriptional regulator
VDTEHDRPASRRGPYAKTTETRRRIVAACAEAFGESGFTAATMADVARRAGISHTGLLHHFPTKEALLVAVLAERYRRSGEQLADRRALDPGDHPFESLRGLLELMHAEESEAGILELGAVLAGEATVASHPAHDFFATRLASARRFYAQVFAGLAARGRLRGDIPPERLAVMTTAMLDGLRTQWLYDRDAVDVHETITAFLRTVVVRPTDRE